MSLDLAFDTKHIGMPEELVHRPFVWAYLAVFTWTSGGLYFFFFENQFPKKNFYRFLLQASLHLSFLHIVCKPCLFGKKR